MAEHAFRGPELTSRRRAVAVLRAIEMALGCERLQAVDRGAVEAFRKQLKKKLDATERKSPEISGCVIRKRRNRR